MSEKFGKIVGKGAWIGACLGIALWIALLVHASLAIRSSESATQVLRIGPLTISELSKHTIAHHIQLGLQFRPGFIWMLAVSAALGGGISYAYSLVRRS